MARSWKTVRVFISSTFRDMHAERDHLVKVVFPELRDRMAGRHLNLVDIDLRWGITEEEAEQGKALEICLEEIERSRPFFIGVLGTSLDVNGSTRNRMIRVFEGQFSGVAGLRTAHWHCPVRSFGT